MQFGCCSGNATLSWNLLKGPEYGGGGEGAGAGGHGMEGMGVGGMGVGTAGVGGGVGVPGIIPET